MIETNAFTFHNREVNEFVITGLPRFKLERLEENTARLYFVNDVDTEIPIPDGVILVNSYGTQVRPVAHNFIVSWIEQWYSLRLKGQELFRLKRQCQFTTHVSLDSK